MEVGRTEAGRTGARVATLGAAATTRATATRAAEVLFVTTDEKAAGPGRTDKSPSEPRRTARPGTNWPAMDLFIAKTKYFYK